MTLPVAKNERTGSGYHVRSMETLYRTFARFLTSASSSLMLGGGSHGHDFVSLAPETVCSDCV